MDLWGKLKWKWQVIQRLGLWESIRYRQCHARSGQPELMGVTFTLRPRGYPYPLLLRYGTSDLGVFRQIFVEHEYTPIRVSRDIRLIVDCGANVGFASAYFLHRFPKAHVLAVEPDPANFAMLERNLRPFGDRCRLINAGIWSHQTGLVVCHFGVGKEWSTQVRECLPGETPDVQATDIPTLLTLSKTERIDLLKVDIEGSEVVLFGAGSRRWLGIVGNIVSELHGPECENIFFQALADFRYDVSTSGELTICRNIRHTPAVTVPL